MESIEELFRQLGSPDQAVAHEALQKLRNLVWRASDPAQAAERQKLAAALAAELKKEHSALVVAQLCELLSLIASDDQVASLASLVAGESTREIARYAIERTSSPAATDALAQATRTGTPARFRIGAINALASRKTKDGVAALVESLASDELEVRLAAAEALAEQGRDDLDEHIARLNTEGNERAAKRVARARVRLAATLAKQGNKQSASQIYRRLIAAQVPQAQRDAAKRALDGLG